LEGNKMDRNLKKIVIDGRSYKVRIHRKVVQNSDSCKIIIPAYMPNIMSKEITRVCIQSININVVFNKTEPINPFLNKKCNKFKVFIQHKMGDQFKDASYANAIGLEIGIRCIEPSAKYVFTMHSDTLVLKDNWLSYFKSKLNNEIKIVSFRKDPKRVNALHIAGMLMDFTLFEKLNMSFMPNMRQERYPDLPEYDVGDQITLDILKNNYKTFVCKNTFNNPKLIEDIPDSNPLKYLHVDKSFDDNKNVIFLHLGRGIVKSVGEYKEKGKINPQQWIRFTKNIGLANSHNPNRLSHEVVSPLFGRLDYSIRRYYVDEFHERNIYMFPKSAKILDIGGKKVRKRGQFDIEKYPVQVKYVNIDPGTNPDYLYKGSNIPIESNSFDGVVCSEVLEHVRNPTSILKEAFRVLKPGGLMFICVPFLFRIHPDPDDFGRYTDQYLRIILKEIGFENIIIEKQGLYFSVLVDMLRGYVLEMQKEERPKSKILQWFLSQMVAYGKRKALELEQRNYFKYHPFFNSYTTGYSMIARKGVYEHGK
jgi:SAM-dependent methyltransferase